MDINAFKKPVKREELSALFGCSDREARGKIAELQENYNIVNLQNGKGYFLADDNTAKRYALQEMGRAIKIFNKARKMLGRVTKGEDIKVPVKAHFRCINRTRQIDLNQITFLTEE